METPGDSDKEFERELEVWQRIPDDLRHPLLDALKKGVVAFDYLEDPRDTQKAEKAYGDFLETTLEELRKAGVNVDPWLEDKSHPLHLYTEGSPTNSLLYGWPRTRLGDFRKVIDFFEQTLPQEKAISPSSSE